MRRPLKLEGRVLLDSGKKYGWKGRVEPEWKEFQKSANVVYGIHLFFHYEIFIEYPPCARHYC